MNRIKILIPIIFLTAIIVLLVILLNPSHRYNKISVDESKWNSIISTRQESEDLALESIKFNDYNLSIDKNTLYYSIVNSNTTKYNPDVSFVATDYNAKIAVLHDEITDEKVNGSHVFKLMIYNNNEYHIYNLICTGFPILSIRYNETVENKQKNIPVQVYLFNNLGNTPNRIMISDGKLKINENGYTFSLRMMTPGKNIRENRQSVFNMKPNSEYVLNKSDENTNIDDDRSKHLVELFINNEYKGLYSLGHMQEKNN